MTGAIKKHQQDVVGKITSGGQRARHHLVAADVHGRGAYHSQQHAGGEAHERCRGERTHDVIEQAADAGGESFFFPLLRVISLDHANAAQRFGRAVL